MSWISWINVVLGLWLVAAAFVFRHTPASGVPENVVTGLFVALAALWAARAFRPVMSLVASWTVVFIGLWVVVAPFSLRYERWSLSITNDVIVGIAIVALGMANTLAKTRRMPS